MSAKRRVRFKLGVLDRTLGFPGDPEALAWAAELLFEGLTVSVLPKGTLADRAVQKQYKEGARKGKIALAALGIEAADPAALEAALGQAIPIAKALGVTLVRVPVPGAARTDTEREFIAYLLGKVAPVAERANVTLALASSFAAREAVPLLGRSKAMRISYDVGAATRAKLDVNDELKWLHETKKLGEVHLREPAGFLGKGSVDCAAVITTLADLGYDRWLHLATDAPTGDPEADTLENQRYVRGIIRSYNGE